MILLMLCAVALVSVGAILRVRPVRALLATACSMVGAGLSLGAVVVSCVSGCSGSAAQRQVRAADGIGRAFNRAQPVVLDAYERGSRVVIDAACGETRPCADPDSAREALAAHRAKWAPVWVAWEAARLAHDAWSTASEMCLAQASDSGDGGDTCTTRVDVLGARALVLSRELRCALTGVGVTVMGGCDGVPAESDGGSNE